MKSILIATSTYSLALLSGPLRTVLLLYHKPASQSLQEILFASILLLLRETKQLTGSIFSVFYFYFSKHGSPVSPKELFIKGPWLTNEKRINKKI